MNILLSGGTGLIGRALCQRWLAEGHQLTVWSRRPEQVPALCGATVQGLARLEDYPAERPLDRVVNLAGAPIADRPWTQARRQLLRDSRIGLTRELVSWLGRRAGPPPLLLSGSAVGYYGDAGDRRLDEQAEAGSDFAAQLCRDWEAEALAAQAFGCRVVLLRTGLILSAEGGFLGRLRTPFRLGLGGPIGSGRQWMPWIHLQDHIGLIDFLAGQAQAEGPYNLCAPEPVRNADFARALGRSLQRPARLPLPAFALRLGLGEMAGLLLGGQQAEPQRALQAGYVFRYTDLDVALASLAGHRG